MTTRKSLFRLIIIGPAGRHDAPWDRRNDGPPTARNLGFVMDYLGHRFRAASARVVERATNAVVCYWFADAGRAD